jgi:hypothetical protein
MSAGSEHANGHIRDAHMAYALPSLNAHVCGPQRTGGNVFDEVNNQSALTLIIRRI